MIEKHLQEMLLRRRDKFMIPASLVATVNVNNSLGHAFLVLTKDRYAKIIVVDNENLYRGQLSLAMITDRLLETDRINVEKLNELTVADVMQTDAPVIQDPFAIEKNLHLLLDQSFLAVVNKDGIFCGIVTRRELLKTVNYTLHNFGETYKITPKNK
ncbi:MAG: CBS domain-containing protein [Limosilactobacillus sp.]|jgi:predicted transcriptional regulator|uniref:cyclic-di-AMP-binding protein CbpB n=1 Tax=Limosilactobacillus sp. TaxID=2773925 RepID=UPI0025BA434B|nr:cyclic-di-AMP-binding protein CbpB [Limosilactobacillus sp.]MCI1975379.1 CBS domain-containing protein [Limosilactobacillus sp.]MCI2031126.1 CBS domain-containing protein [Limosilactobacillus sp.]